MENAVEALKMAGAVLLFMIALSVSIMSFGQARQAADSAVYDLDRETAYIDGDFFYKSQGTTRQVSLETIVPAVMRVFNETYEIRFEFKNGDNEPVYTTKNILTGERQEYYSLNDASVSHEGVVGKELFLRAILYGADKAEIDGYTFNDFYKNEIDLPTYSLVKRLQGKTITEKAGIKKEETQSNANEKKKRIITYKVT